MISEDYPNAMDIVDEYRLGLKIIIENGLYQQILEKYYGAGKIPNDWFRDLEGFDEVGHNMQKMILIIEDNPDNMDLVGEILEDARYGLKKAVRAEDGIELLHQNVIDLVLMDVSLPDMNGLDATRLIRSDEKFNMIPIIGLSAHAMKHDTDAALMAGCNDYQIKPINEDVLLKTISRLLS